MNRSRRHALALLASPLVDALPRSGLAQQPGQLPVVGVLSGASEAGPHPQIDAFKEGLKGHGLVDGRTVRLVIVYSGGKSERLPDLVRVLVAEGARVIVCGGTTAVSAAHRGAPSTPIVMWGSADPVLMGFAQSLARPGGHVTGLSILGEEITIKTFQLLKETVPTARAFFALLQSANPGNVEFRRMFDQAGRQLGVRIEARDIAAVEDIPATLDDAVRQSIDGVCVTQDAFFFRHRETLFRHAIERRLPTISGNLDYCRAGALLAYALDMSALARRAGYYVAEILKGAEPATLPIEQPTAIRLAVNMKTAKLIGVTIPPLMLARADEVIE
jgi:putative ABC transport system substrate-binding protein